MVRNKNIQFDLLNYAEILKEFARFNFGATSSAHKFKGYVNVDPVICDPGCLKYPDSHQKYVAID